MKASVPSRPVRDSQLVQIVDAALADAVRRSGPFLVCHPGCTHCCVGAFAINQLDVARLREGLATLDHSDPQRAARVRRRAKQSLARIGPDFPGDLATGLLCESPRAQRKFEAFANDEPCPALDPITGMCDLYAHRPLTCRAFGPPVRVETQEDHRSSRSTNERSRSGCGAENQIPKNRSTENQKPVAFGVCELCFHGATDDEIAAAEMRVDPDGLEPQLLEQLESETNAKGRTIVAFALAIEP